MADRPTPHDGAGGSQGSTPQPFARIVRARSLRAALIPANDNREPPARRLKRLAIVGGAFCLPILLVVALLML